MLEALEPRLLLSAGLVISEFLADNATGLKDYQSEYCDWLEISNPTTQTVVLTGWKLKDSGDEWTFPAGTTIGPGEFLRVFASGKGKATYTPAPPAGELHTSFKLSAGGEYLGLIDNLGNVVHEYHDFPQQQTDISYGIAQDIETTSLVASGQAAEYLVPTGTVSGWFGVGFNDATWKTGQTGLGYAGLVSGLAVHNVKASVNVGDLATALSVLTTPAQQTGSWAETRSVFNCDNDGWGAGHYAGAATGEANVPGFTGAQDNFVTEATGYVTIPSAGSWTFGVNSDDGFRLTIAGATVTAVTGATNGAGTDMLEYASPRGSNDTFGVFSFPAGGTYELHLVFYENGGGACAEMFAAPGPWTYFDAAAFDLVGDTANGGLAAMSLPAGGGGGAGGAETGTFASLVATNLRAEVKGVNSTVYVRIPFSIANPAALESLTLRMRYDDGYVAYLNGTEIARKNAPASPVWNSAATAQRTDAQAVAWENLDVWQYRYLLNADDGVGAADNVLAIQVLNYSAGDADLLVLPELAQFRYLGMGEHYFAIPTPGAANTSEYWLHVEDTKFSSDRGFYDAPFSLAISTTTPGAAIYYTTDGSAPTQTNGTLYGGPITIQTTATVRARAYKAGYEPTDIDTETFIFPDDILEQPAAPAGFPTDWLGTAADYEMDPDVVNNPLYADLMRQALESLPTMSMVSTVADMFGPNGIYPNSGDESNTREVPGSIEWINPDGSDGFQIDAGLRIYGGAFRGMGLTRKHSFRLMFKDDYGDTKLNYPLFDDPAAATSFDTLILRAGANDAWNNWGAANTQYIIDHFMHETQLALGGASARGRFVNLYVDGLYWGIYEVSERPDSSFSSTYFGGDKDQWDNLNAGDPTNESDGTTWNSMLTQVRAGLGDMTSYQRIQGNNADGTPNATYTDLLDMDNYIQYMMSNIYGGTGDWPGHNYYVGCQKPPNSTGFKFFNWDSEGAIVVWSGLDSNVIGVTDGAAEPWNALRQNSEFRSLVADYVYKYFFNDGALTAQACYDRYKALADVVAPAIVGESARWGDQAAASPYTLDTWETTRDYVLNTYMPQRSAKVLQQLKDAGLYPTNFDPPTMLLNGAARHGGTFLPGDVLSLTASTGTIYWTTDGSDPRPLGGGAPDPADAYSGTLSLQQGTHVRARVYDSATGAWSALNEATFYADLAPSIRITEIMYNPRPPTAAEIAAGFVNNDDFEFVEVRNISAGRKLPLEGLRFGNGIDFTFPAISLPPGGYVVVAKNVEAFHFRYPTFFGTLTGPFTGALDNAGERIRLDSPIGGVIQDFAYADGWYDHTDGEGFSLTVRDAQQALALWDLSDGWRASAAPGGSPGYGDTLIAPGSIIINEVLAHTDLPLVDAIELRNVSSAPVNVSGWFLSDAKTDGLGNSTLTKYQIPARPDIAPGGYLVLYADQTFGSAFLLSELGDEVYLSSYAGSVAGGYREHVDFGATPRNTSIGLVTKSTGGTDFALLAHPTLGADNAAAYVDDLAINELMYHPANPSPAEVAAGFVNSDDFEFIEIRNNSTTASHDLTDYYVAGGIGFSFGWYDADSAGHESCTLEQGATARWTATLPAGAATYEVFARWDVLDAEGLARNLDGQASYSIQHAGGTSTVLRDQSPDPLVEGPDYQDEDGWVSLGSYTFNSAASVILTRTSGDPDNWTIADQVRFVKPGLTMQVNTPVLESRSMGTGRTVLGPGDYVVLVRNYAAFDLRDGIAAHSIPVAGAYTGQMNNNGDKVRLMVAGDAEPTGFIPYYRVDYVNYGDAVPWPVEADGPGPGLNRVNPAAYGNDAANWQASAARGTPGAANLGIDRTAPTMPSGLAAHVTIAPSTIHLTWAAASDPESFVDHYVVYRDGVALATAATPSYDDAAVTPAVTYSYQVSAVNRDGYESPLSLAVTAGVPGVVGTYTTDSRHIEITFSEPLTAAAALTLANYGFSGGELAWVALRSGDTKIVLTTQAEMTLNQSYTVTASNLTTVSGNELPASLAIPIVYEAIGTGTILREYWLGIGGGAVTDLTNNANYPNNPSGRSTLTAFEAPGNWADNYGTRIYGYVHPPTTGTYTFWIASDDASALYLSTDADPAHKVQIAYAPGATGARNYASYTEQQSVAITLVAGQKYYIEALQKEGGGDDYVSVRWQLPGGVWESSGDPSLPIPGIRLSPYGLVTTPVAGFVAVSPDPRTTAVDQVRIVFNEPVWGLDVGDLRLTRDGGANLLTGNQALATTDRITWTLAGLAGLTAPAGTYALTFVAAGSNVYDEGGYSPTSNAYDTWLTDMTGPTVSIVPVAPDPRNSAVSAIDIVFSEPVWGLEVADLKLTRDDGSNLLTGGESLTTTDHITWRLGGLLNLTGEGRTDFVAYNDHAPGGGTGANTTTYSTYSNNQTVSGPLKDAATGEPANVTLTVSSTGISYQGSQGNPASGTDAYNVFNGHVDFTGTPAPSLEVSAGNNSSYTYTFSGLDGGDLAVYNFAGTAVRGDSAYTRRWTLVTLSGAASATPAHSSGVGVVVISPMQAAIWTGANSGAGQGFLAAWTDIDPGPDGQFAVVSQQYTGAIPASVDAGGVANDGKAYAISGVRLEEIAAASPGVSGQYVLSLTGASSGIHDGAGNPVVGDAVESWRADVDAPTADIVDVAPDPRGDGVARATIRFSEPVTGLDVADIRLTRNGGANLLTGGQALMTTDNITWTLAGLAGITAAGGAYALSVVAAGSGVADAAGNALAADAADAWVMDPAIAPAVTGFVCNDGQGRPYELTSISVSFTQNVSASLDVTDLVVTNDSTGAALDLATAGLTWDDLTNTAHWDLSGLTAGPGYYTALLPAGAVSNGAGQPLGGAGDYQALFMVALLGDTNLDGTVGTADLSALQANFGLSGATWSQGDLNHDQAVGFDDYLLLKSSFGQALAPRPVSLPAAVPLAATEPLALPAAPTTGEPTFDLLTAARPAAGGGWARIAPTPGAAVLLDGLLDALSATRRLTVRLGSTSL